MGVLWEMYRKLIQNGTGDSLISRPNKELPVELHPDARMASEESKNDSAHE